MLMMLSMSMISLMLSSLIYGLTFLVSMKQNSYKEKMSPYECGFSPIKNSRTPFSLRFFLLIILFLIFDVELALIMPLVLAQKLSWGPQIFFVAVMLMLILILGLLHEWMQNSLEWEG